MQGVTKKFCCAFGWSRVRYGGVLAGARPVPAGACGGLSELTGGTSSGREAVRTATTSITGLKTRVDEQPPAIEPNPELKTHFQSVKMGGGPKVPYPKHVWSPAGGWYAQPNNWKANTLIAGAVMASIVAITWKFSAGREKWARTPEPQGWYPSRNWSKHLAELDAERDAAEKKA